MWGKLAFALCLVWFSAASALAQEEKAAEPKELSGMSIVGNDDAPKSLYIVPWKSSEMGVETSLSRMLNEGDLPVDRDVFRRELDFYQVSAANRTPPLQGQSESIAQASEKQAGPQLFSSPKF